MKTSKWMGCALLTALSVTVGCQRTVIYNASPRPVYVAKECGEKTKLTPSYMSAVVWGDPARICVRPDEVSGFYYEMPAKTPAGFATHGRPPLVATTKYRLEQDYTLYLVEQGACPCKDSIADQPAGFPLLPLTE